MNKSPGRPARGAFIRPMQGWWRRDPYFIQYMMREATALIVAFYAIVLLVGVVRLAQGEAAWNGWLEALRTPWGLLLSSVTFVVMVYHAWSWFEIMPKTMPMLFVGGRRVAAATITRAGLAATVLASLVLYGLAWALRP